MATARLNLESSANFTVYTSVAADVDLRKAYPGWAQGSPDRLPRLLIYSGGVLVVKGEQGNTVTLPGAFANFQLAIAPAWLLSAGTTATAILVQW
mgnify:CR=1 FL=1